MHIIQKLGKAFAFKPNVIEQQIRDAALLRYPANKQSLMRPTSIFCDSKDVEDAVLWFSKRSGRLPEFITTFDNPKHKNKYNIPAIPFKDLCQSLEILPLIFDPLKPRKKGLALAQSGVKTFTFHVYPKFGIARIDYNFYSKFKTELHSLWNRLEDEESRLVLASIIKHRITGDCGFLRVSEYKEYNHPLVKAEAGDIVLDCGSSNGNTSIAFAKQVGNKGKVYAFEPCPKNVQRIKENCKENKTDNIVIVNSAVASTSGTARFLAGRGDSSRISTAAEEGIEVEKISIDDFSKRNNNLKIDLISLDIEGAEPDAILGADDVIKKFRPKLQISIYHKPKHLFEIPLSFLKKYPDYVLFIGHHEVYSTETDAYLIPREKLPV